MSQSKRFDIPELVNDIAKHMYVDLRQNLLSHPGEKGFGREEVVRRFLQSHLPQRLGVSSGFVFDRTGRMSNQLDVIIYDRGETPILQAAGGIAVFPCETVVSVGQVKSSTTSARELKSAYANLRSAKILSRGGSQNVYTGSPVDPEANHLDQLFTFVFVSGKHLGKKTACRALFETLAQDERHLWPNLTLMFDDYMMTLGCPRGACPNPMDALGITFVDDASNGELLLHFWRMLARAAQATSVSRFPYWDYLDGEKGMHQTLYRFRDAPIDGTLPTHMADHLPFDTEWNLTGRDPDPHEPTHWEES